MNKTLRVSDAITRYQGRYALTTTTLAAELATTEDRLARLGWWSISDFADRPFGLVVGSLAELGCCDSEGLAVILLQAVELVDA